MPRLHRITTVLLCAAFSTSCFSQTPTKNPVAVISKVLADLGADKIQDASLSGSVIFTAGSTTETGTFTAESAVNGFHKLTLSLRTATRTDQEAPSNGIVVGSWTDSHGSLHQIPQHNVLVDHSWFFPLIALARYLHSSHSSLVFVAQETKKGISVQHFELNNHVRADGSVGSPKLAHLERLQLYLASDTLRPAFLTFNLHDDSNALIDVPIEIRYDNYAQISGVWVPTEVRRYVNSALTLQLTIQTAQFDTGFAGSASN